MYCNVVAIDGVIKNQLVSSYLEFLTMDKVYTPSDSDS
jgi:hypothetical protein